MFNLIAAVFAIVLVGALSLAGIYYSGEAVSSRVKDTDYAEIVNGANQIKGAMELYKAREGFYPDFPTTAEMLTMLVSEGYLSGVPSGTWEIADLVIQRSLVDAEQCSSVNERAGLDVSLAAPDGCPACADAGFATWPACENP